MTLNNQSIAKKANDYSRDLIREGTTQLQNNVYDLNKQLALRHALTEIREASRQSDFFLDVDNTIRLFEQRVADCKKFSIGNCYELALMALDYMIREHPDINSEVYHIKGGDHAFLVIGRDINSDPIRPETWGKDAYICDPWSDSVYPATDYLEKTKDFYAIERKDGRRENRTQDFDLSKHQMEPMINQNSSYILKHASESNTILLDVFSDINNRFLAIYDDLANDLIKSLPKLKKQYGDDDARVYIIEARITAIQLTTEELRKNFNEYTAQIKNEQISDRNTYQPHKNINDNLQQLMKSQINKLRDSKTLSTNEHEYLSQFKEDSLITMIMKFLKIQPQASRDYKTAVNKSEEQISELSHLISSSFKK